MPALARPGKEAAQTRPGGWLLRQSIPFPSPDGPPPPRCLAGSRADARPPCGGQLHQEAVGAIAREYGWPK